MSGIARWSYTAKAQVKPLLKGPRRGGSATYGDPYEILCTYTALQLSKMEASAALLGHVIRYEIYTEDPRPGKGDLIQLPDTDEWQKILDRTVWDMSPFGQNPDYKLVT